MSNETAERPEGPGPWAWLAHRWGWVLGALVVGELVSLLVRTTMRDSGLDAPVGWLNLAVLLVFFFGLGPVSAHFSRLCVECVKAVPVDGAARADRRKTSLYVFHLVHDRPVRAVVVFMTSLLLPTVLVFAGVLERGSLPVMLAGSASFLGYVAGAGILAATHRPLVPWCPWCRWGRGGDGPVETVPEPTPPSRSPDRMT